MCPSAIAVRIASAVSSSAQPPHGMSSARFACGWMSWTRSRSVLALQVRRSRAPPCTIATAASLSRKRLELRERGLGRRAADHAVVARVALELARDPLERLGVLVDGQDERKLAHRSGTNAARRHSPSSPLSSCVPRSSKRKPRRSGERTREIGDEDLAGAGGRHDPRRLVHRDAADVRADELDLADVDADADLRRRASRRNAESRRRSAAPAPARRRSPASRRPSCSTSRPP